MATYYVRSAAAGAGTGADWANAYTTLTAAFSGKAAGDTFYVAADHSQSAAAAVSLTTAGILSNPSKVICVDHTGSVPPVAADLRTTAQVATTGGGTNHINVHGSTYYFGIIFNSSASVICPSASTAALRFDSCSLRAGGIGSIGVGGSSTFHTTYVEWRNTTASFSFTGGSISVVLCRFVWRDTPSALLGTIPTSIFTFISTRGAIVDCIGVDLSAAGSGKTIVAATTQATGVTARFVDCKLNASVTKAATPTVPGSNETDFIRSGASGVNYTVHSMRYAGTLDEETSIVLSGGASDGTTPIAWKIVTSANATWTFPFECPPIAIWNDVTGSVRTATIQGIWGGGAVPLDDEIWVELEYLGDASSPQGSFVNDGKATILTTAVGQAAGSGTWGGSTTKFALGVAFTAQQKGWVYARVKCAKASSTFYIDPLITLT